ncbi:MAG: hypothetical protein CMK09_09050 [Ponticaulis sp.]|nr:hypothetical protein [Ponticaulis sp.]|tara:strand:+ start:38114 stop:38524 length:411 start_codon:yes stop_codon:yes gene_type:complete
MSLSSRHLCKFRVEVGAPTTVDDGEFGRRFIPITGGEVSGSLTGKILSGGGDWQTLLPDDVLEIRAHYTVEIDGQGLVEIQSDGVRALREDETVYFRTSIRFHTAAPGLRHLNQTLALAVGRKAPDGVHLDIYEIL